MSERLYCDVSDCDRPTFRDGKCATHTKQLQRTGKTQPIAEKVSAVQRCHDAWDLVLNAGDDNEEYETRLRAAISASKALGRKESLEAIRTGMARAKAKGVRIGRPPKVSDEELLRLLKLFGTQAMVARVLRLARSTVCERLVTVRKRRVSEHRPRMAG